MRLMISGATQILRGLAALWLRFWRAVRYWRYLRYSWHLAWIKARP